MNSDILDMINGRWISGEHMAKRMQGSEFISDLASFLAAVHRIKPKQLTGVDYGASRMYPIVDKLRKYPPPNNEKFCEDSIKQFDAIDFSETTFIHGDLWYKNVIVKDEKFQGLIDWDKACMADPHWELRMLRRWIGWDGMEKLIFFYNCSIGTELRSDTIRVLDKIALCNSYNERIRKPNPDKPVSLIQGYIQHWPESWWQK
jgi:thiamine kinase-like enzyme